MQKRTLGKTGLQVSVIGFGGIPIQQVDMENAVKILRRGRELGINFFDSARVYTDSEEKMGKALSDFRKEIYLASKTIRRSYEEAAEDVNISLKNLRTDIIDVYQVHDVKNEREFEQVFREDGSYRALEEARKKGKIKFIGFSAHRPEILRRLIDTGKFDTVQLGYNPVDKELNDEIITYAYRKGMGIIGMKPLAGGLLNNAQVCLRFVLAKEVSTVIPGMKAMAEVEENARVGLSSLTITEQERKRLLEEADKLGKNFCRRCGYCLPCPEGIDIPQIFRLERYFVTYYYESFAREEYARLKVKADACAECGDCEEKCPYNLPIQEMLKQAHARLSSTA